MNAGARNTQVRVYRRSSQLAGSGDAVNQWGLVGSMWVQMAPTNTSRLLLADTILRERTTIVAKSDAIQDFDLPAAGDILTLDDERTFVVEGAFDVDERRREWHIALSEYKPEFEAEPPRDKNVIEDYDWDSEYWASDATALVLPERNDLFDDLGSVETVDVGLSTEGLLSEGLPESLVNEAFQAANGTAFRIAGQTPAWGDDKGFQHWRAILFLDSLPDTGLFWQTQGPSSPQAQSVYFRMAGGEAIRAVMQLGSVRSLDVPVVRGWVLCDFVAGPSYFRFRVNGVETTFDGGDEVFQFSHNAIGMGGSSSGAAQPPDAKFLFWGFRNLDADPGLQEHINDVERVIGDPPDVIDIFEKHGPWLVEYSTHSIQGTTGPWDSDASIGPMLASADPVELGVSTAELRDPAIGAARVDAAMRTTEGQASFFNGTAAPAFLDRLEPVWIRCLFRLNGPPGNGRQTLDIWTATTNSWALRGLTANRISFLWRDDDTVGSIGNTIVQIADEWVLTDIVTDPAAGLQTVWQNGAQFDFDFGGVMKVPGLDIRLGIHATRNGTNAQALESLWWGWKHIADFGEVTRDLHVGDVEALGLPVRPALTGPPFPGGRG